MDFYGEGRYQFITHLIPILRENFGQTKLYYKNFLWNFIGKNTNEMNFFIDLFNGLAILDLSEKEISFDVFKNTILEIFKLSNQYLSIEFQEEEQEELSDSLALILFLTNNDNKILSKDQEFIFYTNNIYESDLNIYFRAQAKNMLDSCNIFKNQISFYNDFSYQNQNKIEEVIKKYYDNRQQYSEKFLEDQS